MEIRFPLILDGATGTELQKRGYGGDVSAEQWTLEHPDVIVDIQRGYVAAGSQVLYTPTFGANRQKLEERSIFNQTADYNRRLAALSREAAGGKAWIAGDLAPTGLFLAPLGEASFEDLVDIYTEQAAGLEAAGVEVPTTWAELEDVCQALVDFYGGDVYPWGIDMTTDEGQAAFAYYAWGNGGGFVDDEGNWTINSPENIEAVEFAVNLYKKGYTNPNPATQTRYDLQDMFGAGKLAMVIAPNSLPTYIATKGYTDVNYAVADIPHNEGKSSSSVGVMDRIMAFKDDSAPDQAARNEAIGKFLTFFYDPENYVGWVSMEDFLPAVNSAVAALVEANPSFEAWLKVLDGCKFYPTAKTEWIDVKQGAAAVEQSALTGGDVKTLLDELQAKITK